jgi:hypothetical protein
MNVLNKTCINIHFVYLVVFSVCRVGGHFLSCYVVSKWMSVHREYEFVCYCHSILCTFMLMWSMEFHFMTSNC